MCSEEFWRSDLGFTIRCTWQVLYHLFFNAVITVFIILLLYLIDLLTHALHGNGIGSTIVPSYISPASVPPGGNSFATDYFAFLLEYIHKGGAILIYILFSGVDLYFLLKKQFREHSDRERHDNMNHN